MVARILTDAEYFAMQRPCCRFNLSLIALIAYIFNYVMEYLIVYAVSFHEMHGML